MAVVNDMNMYGMLERKPPLVSVCVVAFRHASYIRQCLDGIAMQICNFDFEVVVRDDASDDGTAAVVEDYISREGSGRFRLVKPECNEGMGRNFVAALRECRGEYIAICEGDDFWTDTSKLQVQVDAMCANHLAMICVHPCRLYRSENDFSSIDSWMGSEVWEFTAQDVLNVPGKFAPTPSYMIKKEVVDALPAWVVNAPVLDFVLEMYALTLGHGLYLPNVMCAYRVFSSGSWSDSLRKQGGRHMIDMNTKLLDLHRKLSVQSQFKGLRFGRKMAAAELGVALGNLLECEYTDFSVWVESSWKTDCRVSIGQRIFYRLRRFPRLARMLLLVKRAIYMLMKYK